MRYARLLFEGLLVAFLGALALYELRHHLVGGLLLAIAVCVLGTMVVGYLEGRKAPKVVAEPQASRLDIHHYFHVVVEGLHQIFLSSAVADRWKFDSTGTLTDASLQEGGPETMSEDTYNVTSHGQQGGITAGQINVNQAPVPKAIARVAGEPNQKGPHDRYYTMFHISLEHAALISQITFQIRAPSVAGCHLRPGWNPVFGLMGSAVVTTRDGDRYVRTGVASPRGSIDLMVETAEPEEDIRIDTILS